MNMRTTPDAQGVVHLMLDNPLVNALTCAMVEELVDALARCAEDPATSVIVIGGVGRHFCAGADLREQQAAWQTGGKGPADMGLNLYCALLGFSKPMIGMAHGGSPAIWPSRNALKPRP